MTEEIKNWVLEYSSDFNETMIYHNDGVSWFDAPLPPKNHKCTPQTKAYMNYFTLVYRCACGATAINEEVPTVWIEKNQTRRNLERFKPESEESKSAFQRLIKRLFNR